MLRKRISCAPCSHLLKINFLLLLVRLFFPLTYAQYAPTSVFFDGFATISLKSILGLLFMHHF